MQHTLSSATWPEKSSPVWKQFPAVEFSVTDDRAHPGGFAKPVHVHTIRWTIPSSGGTSRPDQVIQWIQKPEKCWYLFYIFLHNPVDKVSRQAVVLRPRTVHLAPARRLPKARRDVRGFQQMAPLRGIGSADSLYKATTDLHSV